MLYTITISRYVKENTVTIFLLAKAISEIKHTPKFHAITKIPYNVLEIRNRHTHMYVIHTK